MILGHILQAQTKYAIKCKLHQLNTNSINVLKPLRYISNLIQVAGYNGLAASYIIVHYCDNTGFDQRIFSYLNSCQSDDNFSIWDRNKVIYLRVSTTIRGQLDLWYKSVRRPWTTVSTTIFIYFNSKAKKRLPKKRPMFIE